MSWPHIAQALTLFREISQLPHININLMLTLALANDPFFQKTTVQFFKSATRRHPKFPLARTFQYGFSVCDLKEGFEAYLASIEPSARRNLKKAERLGYRFQRINYNDHLQDITQIRRSADIRQGKPVPKRILDLANPISNPPSRTKFHDYPYFAVIKDDRVLAFAGCLVAGEICQIEEIFGHVQYQNDGIVPMLIIETVRHLTQEYPMVSYFSYGNHYGASSTMKRFKKKLGFVPHKVSWNLNG